MKVKHRFPEEYKSILNKEFRKILDEIELVDFSGSPGIFDPLQTIFVGQQVPTSEIVNLIARLRVNHFINLDVANLKRSLITAAGTAITPGIFLKDPIPFLLPAETPAPIRSVRIRFSSGKARASVLSSLGEFLEGQKSAKAMTEAAIIIADEMVGNALQSVIDENGKRVFPRDRSANAKIVMDPGKEGVLFAAHDSKHLVIGCEDPYGSVDPSTLVDILVQTFDPAFQADAMASALGCKMIIEHSYEMIVVSRRNIRTTVCCVIRMDHTLRQHRELPKNFHFHFF